MNKTLIIGAGEVGKALFGILKKHYTTYIQDKTNGLVMKIDVMHICFPYSKTFIGDVKDYVEIHRPKITVIHSTVPIGTSRQCQAFHSPIRGEHPNLEKSLRTFVKYLAPKNQTLKQYFEKVGIPIKLVNKTEDTEALKLWSTTQYGMFILLQKGIYRFCQENNLDFKLIYTEANRTYNDAYLKLGRQNVLRPILRQMRGGIGGHCVLENCDLLKHFFTRLIKRMNKDYE